MDTPELSLTPFMKEFLSSGQNNFKVEVNSYKTRGKPTELIISGQRGSWHSLKGGYNPEKRHSQNIDLGGITFEIFFNPETLTWLKVVPPESTRVHMLTQRLQTSCDIGRTALTIAGLSDMAHQLRECSIEIDDKISGTRKSVYGFTSPHIGPSLEFYYKSLIKGAPHSNLPRDFQDFILRVYQMTYEQAQRLYHEHGFWTEDPNPGNILLFFGQDGVRPTLIDFATRMQRVSLTNTTNQDPIRRYEHTREKMTKRHTAVLRQNFEKECSKLGVKLP